MNINQTIEIDTGLKKCWPLKEKTEYDSEQVEVTTYDSDNNIILKLHATNDCTTNVKVNNGVNEKTYKVEIKTPVTKISIKETDTDLIVGENTTISCEIYPDNATIKDVIWTSSDNSIATIDNNGMITALRQGSVDIICTSVDNKNNIL